MNNKSGYLQKIGKSLMLPVAALPMCAILMGLGYLLCPGAMQGTEITGLTGRAGYLLVSAGGALINNIPILFVIGVSLGMSSNNNGTACLAGLVSWLIFTTLLSPSAVSVLFPHFAESEIRKIAFSKINNPFIGILAGIIGAECYNRFNNTVLPDSFAFFSGKRFVSIVTAAVSIVVSAILFVCWPFLFNLLVLCGKKIVALKGFGVGIYTFLNRLLIPSGLHHALNNVFWFDTIGIGDLTKFWAGKTSSEVGWSLGMYMSGFFPCFMGGIPGASLAMYNMAKDKKKAKSILFSSALGAFICGISEPFEFTFIFSAFPLFVTYAALCCIISFVTYLSGFRAGFAFSAGATDLLFSANLPAAQKVWMIIPLSALAFALFYAVFRFAIAKFNFKTPGRDYEDDNVINGDNTSVHSAVTGMADSIIACLGGRQNIVSVDCCATRLRIELKDSSAVDEKTAKKAGVIGVNIINKQSVQLIIGTKVQQVCEDVIQAIKNPGLINLNSKIYKKVNHGDIISLGCNNSTFRYTITDSIGIHARPAGKIVQLAKKYESEITVKANEKTADAKSLTQIMSLGAANGTVLTVSAEGPDSSEAIECIKDYISRNL